MRRSYVSWGSRAVPWLCACGAALALSACSGTTDVVGVIDAPPTEVVSSSGDPTESVNARRLSGTGVDETDSEYLYVAGLPLPMREWPGPAVPWPLSTRLRMFFSSSSWPGPSGPPDHVEREAFELMGEFSAKRHDEVRFAAPTGDTAERLREFFAAAPVGPHDVPTLVTRDRYDDQYLVVLGSASCERASDHHGGPCPDSPDEQSVEP